MPDEVAKMKGRANREIACVGFVWRLLYMTMDRGDRGPAGCPARVCAVPVRKLVPLL
jgi:hypothetical protein